MHTALVGNGCIADSTEKTTTDIALQTPSRFFVSPRVQMCLGIASQDTFTALVHHARQWLFEWRLKKKDGFFNKKTESVTDLMRKGQTGPSRFPAPESEEDPEILPNGALIGSGNIAFPNRTEVKVELAKLQYNLDVFNNIFTVQLNYFVNRIIGDGVVRIDGSSTEYKKIEGADPNETRYRNTGQLFIPVLSYVNRNLGVMGLGKSYNDKRTFTVTSGSVSEEFVVGIISTAVTGLSIDAANSLLGLTAGTSNDISASVAKEASVTTYNMIVPLYYWDNTTERSQCAYTVIACEMERKVITVAIGCTTVKREELKVTLGVQTYNVSVATLDAVVGDNKEAIKDAKDWLSMNAQTGKAGVTEDPSAALKGTPADAQDIIL